MLAAILAYAATALTLLVVGQFVSLPPVGATLATVTVLTGMARAGITIVDRLRVSGRQAITDDLTGLGNRRLLLPRLGEAIADTDHEVALLLIDLDGFKELNDTLGHHAGDEVLRQIGPRLQEALRPGDTLARLGGDEFAVVLDPGDEASASAAGLRLRAALEQTFAVGGIRVHIDASIGIALFPEHARDALGLLQRADVAMYEAKRTRTGHEVYLPERDHHSRRRLELLGELRDGLADGQLILHYQPKAEIATGDGARRRGARALGAPAARAADADRLPAAGRSQRPRPRADRVRARPCAGGDRRAPPRRVRPVGGGQPRPGRPARPRAAERGRADAREAQLPGVVPAAGGERGRRDGRSRADARGARRAARDRRGDRAGRLRRRPRLARAPQATGRRRDQDRPLVRDAARPRRARRGDRPHHRRPRPPARDAGGGRGRRDAARRGTRSPG